MDQPDFLNGLQPQCPAIVFNFSQSLPGEIARFDSKGFYYKGEFIDDAGEVHRLLKQVLEGQLNIATPPPEPPKNCWLDDEPDLFPSPCVFDDPDEVIDNCIYARIVKCKTDCKYYRVAVHPEPQEPVIPDQYKGHQLHVYRAGFHAGYKHGLTRAPAALTQPAPPTDEERLADFAQWLAREMPPNTIIGDPLWWAPRIWRAALERWGK